MNMDIMEKAENLSAFLKMNKNLQDYCVSKNWSGFIEKVESFIDAVRSSQNEVVRELYLEIVLSPQMKEYQETDAFREFQEEVERESKRIAELEQLLDKFINLGC